METRTKAEADVLKQEVAAYGTEGDYVRAKLYEKTAPKLRDVVTADAPGEIFGLPVKSSLPPSTKSPPSSTSQPLNISTPQHLNTSTSQQKGGAK